MLATIIIAALIFGYLVFLSYRRVTKRSSSCNCGGADCPLKTKQSK